MLRTDDKGLRLRVMADMIRETIWHTGKKDKPKTFGSMILLLCEFVNSLLNRSIFTKPLPRNIEISSFKLGCLGFNFDFQWKRF